ncbi:hypothetical protein KEH51_25635 [[Brevibacterium] frigoritolerans]|uniref:HpcH/HpaI aldolase/citrate lyase domain-containing protein n=1 Tax=Peribacillus frigoritolerans TaxID=450367 RepID=A0A941FSK5_9BACI|nr:hypothetical protein [Peribacillus frigoritolerans]
MITRTWMFIPGSDEKKLKKVQQLCADVFIYDLEDAVSPEGKRCKRFSEEIYQGESGKGKLHQNKWISHTIFFTMTYLI